MQLFCADTCISICLKNKNPYVRLAAEDMQKDFIRVSTHGVCPEITETETDACIIIEENTSDGNEPIKDEGFTIKSEKNAIRISADGYLGTMWGIYTFCEKYLGVEPCYLFNDLETVKHDSLEVPEIDITDKPESFGFRGVFINDEDLLTGWKDGGGIRYLDFPWYGLTVEESVINRIVETVLRLRLNLVIPASFLDIDNPPEKLLADCVAKRGIYLSQHHIEPLGVSAFTFENYCRKYRKTGEFSYAANPAVMEEAWTFYAKKWAEYEHVVWQIGLRGKGDRPVWQDRIPTEEERKAAGDFISRAYEKQTEIVKKVTAGKAKYFTSTLWMEGSVLMEKGYLKYPENAIIVFADTGSNQMYGKEYDAIARNKDGKYGIYYHLQYFGCGPHLAPQTGLDKLYYNINLAYKNNDNAYFIMNVSNVREFVFELQAYSEMVWNMQTYSNDSYLDAYCRKFGDCAAQVKRLVTEYFDSLPCMESGCLPKHYTSKYFNFFTGQTPAQVKNFIVKEGIILKYGDFLLADFCRQPGDNLCKECYEALKPAIPLYTEICRGFERLAKELPEPFKKHIEVKWLLFAKTLLYIYRWYVNLYEAKRYCDLNDFENMKTSLKAACQSLEDYLSYRKAAEYGEFENWYRGDLKMNVKQHLYDTKRRLGQTPDFA